MKKRHRRLMRAAILLAFGLTAVPAWAQNTGFCFECHSGNGFGDTQAATRISRLDERGSVYQNRIHPCPGLRSLAEENFFTESRILRLDEILQELGKKGWDTGVLQRSLHQNAEAFSSLKAEAIRSSSQFSQEASALRSKLQKIYERASQMREETDRRWLIGVGSLVLLGLLLFVGIGYGKMNRIGKLLWLIGLAAGCFTLNACSSGTGEMAKKSPAQEQIDRSLSIARQVSGQLGEASHLSLLLAQMGRHWASINAREAERTFELAWKVASQAQENGAKLQSLDFIAFRWREPSAAAKEKVSFDSVLDLRDQLRQVRGGTWALRAVAEEWLKADPVRGRQALERVLQRATSGKDGEIRDRELRAIAEAWTRVDIQVAWGVCRSIQNPFLRSMALKEVGRAFENRRKSEEVFAEAWQTATKIEPPVERIYAMIRIAASAAPASPADGRNWTQRVWNQIQEEKNLQLRSWLTRDLVQAWSPIDPEQAERWLSEIPAEFPISRAYALLALAKGPQVSEGKKLSLLQTALAEAKKFSDDFAEKKLKRIVVEAISQLDPEKGIALIPLVADPADRSRVLSQIARQQGAKRKEKGLDVADTIPIDAFRQAAIVEVIDQWVDREMDQLRRLSQEALRISASISDPYERIFRLIEIGKNGNSGDGRIASRAFEEAWKSVEEISPSWKKAVASGEIAKAWKQSNPEKADEVLRGIDPTVIRLRNFVAEIRLWAAVDPDRARKMAEEIPSVFPLEKAQGLKAVALALKNSRKDTAWEYLERSLDFILPLPAEGTGREKFIGDVIGEMARLDGGRTFQVLERIQSENMRDAMLGEAARAFIQENSWEGLQRALASTARIGQGTLRLDLYRRIADTAAKLRPAIHSDSLMGPALVGVSFWGQGREQAKREEVKSAPFFKMALQSMQQIKGEKERSFLTSALAADWALIDEEKALQTIDQAAQLFAEPYSHGLLQIATQMKRWNRKEAQGIFEKALGACEKIEDPYLRLRRRLEIAQRWWEIDQGKGKELFTRAREEAEKLLKPGGTKNEILEEILLTWCNREPQSSHAIAANVKVPKIRAAIFTAAARREKSETLGKNGKRLDAALQFARAEQNLRLQGRVAAAWYSLDPSKGLEIVKGIESPAVRSETLKRIAMRNERMSKEESNEQLDLALQEALKIEEGTGKIQFLKNLADHWAKIEAARAEKIYRKIYEMSEEAFASHAF